MTRLDRIRERGEKATAGPWSTDQRRLHVGNKSVTPPAWYVKDQLPGDVCACGGQDESEANATYIAAMRQDGPWMLEKLRQAITVLKVASLHVAPSPLLREINALLAELEADDDQA